MYLFSAPPGWLPVKGPRRPENLGLLLAGSMTISMMFLNLGSSSRESVHSTDPSMLI